MADITTTSEKLERSRVRLSIEVPPDDLQSEYGRAIQRVGRRAKIPGFRPGKAPRHLVENAVGVPTVMQDMLETLVPRAYTSALDETGITPVDQPELDVPELPTLDSPFTFSAEVAVSPTIELGNIADISVEVPTSDVTAEEIETEIEQLRTTQSSWDPVERATVSGDMIQTRIQMMAEGIDKDEPQPYNVIVGENGFPEGFDGAVTGKSSGENASYETDISPNDPNESIRGKHVTFEIQIDGVSERSLPELNDEFARSAGPFDNVEALRTQVTESLTERKAHEAQQEVENQVVNALVDRATFDIADVLIDRERDQVIQDRTRALVNQGVAVDTYLAMTNQSRDSWEDEARTEGLNRIQRGLALDSYAKAEDIQVEPEELEAEIERVAAYYPEERRNLIRTNLLRDESRGQVEGTIRSRKALRTLVAAATDDAAITHDHHHDEPSSAIAAAAESGSDPAGNDDENSQDTPSPLDDSGRKTTET